MQSKTIFIIAQPDITHVVGGAAAIFIHMCNLFAQHGYIIYGICYSTIRGIPDGLRKEVNFVNLKYRYSHKFSYADAMNRLSRELHPDLFIFFFPFLYTAALLEKEFDSVPKILMLHSRPDFYFYNKKTSTDFSPICKNVVSQILFSSFYRLLPACMQKNPVVCISNFSTPTVSVKTDNVRKKIVYLSRLDEYKQQFFLIRAFQLALREIPDWQLDIWGDGAEYYIKLLQEEIDDRHLSRQICLKGITQNPLEILKNYDFCVFPSSFEGFSMGLTDALSVGLPAIGLKKASGVNEQIINQYNGILTNYSEEDFAKNIVELAKNDTLRLQMSNAAKESIQQYNKQTWDSRWLSLVEDIMEHRPIPKFNAPSSELPLFSLDEIKVMSKIPAPFQKIEYVSIELQKARKKYQKLFIIALFLTMVILLLSFLLSYIWLIK